ncbi:MAG: hypothetical protein KIT31_01920 [Deltaproteobacteria bacterium]|nr:hypothetical protein [Deltaproteobacteria bacterium]
MTASRLDTDLPRAEDELRARAAAGKIERWWEVESCTWLGVAVPESTRTLADEALARWTCPDFIEADSRRWTSPTRGRALYAVEHTFEMIFVAARLEVPYLRGRRPALVAWLAGLQGDDGRFAAQEAYEEIEHMRAWERADIAGDEIRAAWQRAIPGCEPLGVTGPHSDLADAWYVTRSLQLLGATPRDPAAAIAWIQSRQCPDGAFRSPLSLEPSGAVHGSPLVDTARAVETLALLGAGPADHDRCVAWLAGAIGTLDPRDLAAWLHIASPLVALGAGRHIATLPFLLQDMPVRDGGHDLYAVLRLIQLLVPIAEQG